MEKAGSKSDTKTDHASSPRLIAWRPLDDIPDDLTVEAIHDDVEGLRVLLRGVDPTKPTLRVRFEDVVAYRNVNESYRLSTWARLAPTGPLPSLVIVVESRFVGWLVEEAGGVLDREELTHYAIYTLEDCIDVVSRLPPIVDWPNA